MELQVIAVPKDSCPFQKLSELGEKTSEAWIFIHKNVFEKLRSNASTFDIQDVDHYILKWKAIDELPKRSIRLDHICLDWFFVTKIHDMKIAFVTPSNEPTDIFILKMEE